MNDRDYFPPPDREGGWRTATRAGAARKKAGIDTAGLDAAFDCAKKSTKNGGLLVARHGWLVYERYFGRGHREAAPNTASCGKSFTSIACGMLMAEFPELFPMGLDQPVFRSTHLPPKAFPLTDKRRAEIKLGQLLSFSAGIRGNNPCTVNGETVTIDPVGPDGWQAMEDDRALGLIEERTPGGAPFSTKTLWCEPGGGYSYATASIHIVSMMVRQIAEMEMEAYLAKKVAGPLEWGPWGFGYKRTEAAKHTPGGGGICLRGTDMLRFLHMLLRGGRWGEQQVVPEDYVARCGRLSPYNTHFPYSLQFNVNTNGERPEIPRDAFWKGGSGGHALYVVPSLDLVAWKLGGRDEQYGQKNTGRPEVATRDDRSGWEKTIEDGEALLETLRLVCVAAK